MGMSTFVAGIRDLDGQFQKMMEVKKACEAAGIGYPEEVRQYFKYPEESERMLREEMESMDIDIAVKKLDVEYSDVYEVDLSKLPKEVKKIQFRNSY